MDVTVTKEEFIRQAASNRGLRVPAFQEWLRKNHLEVMHCTCNGKPVPGLPGHQCGGWKISSPNALQS